MRAGPLVVLAISACGGKATPTPPEIAESAGTPNRMIATIVQPIVDEESYQFFEIDELSPEGVKQLVRGTELVDSFAWLDPHTVIALTDPYTDEGMTIDRYTDGALADSISIPADEWPSGENTLLVTRTGEAWITDCAEPAGCDLFLHVLPAPRGTAKRLPADLDPYRVGGFTHPDPPHATVDAPTHLPCTPPAQIRWVRTQPPVYEVTTVDYLGDTIPSYHRACDAGDTAYDSYTDLGGGMWELAATAPDVGWTLTFFLDDRAVGTIEHGSSIRANPT